MDCGVPFCHSGCPLGNNIPEWNHLSSQEEFKAALDSLLSTNNFPEFTGRVCPAPCETACVLGINEDPVAIESIEMALSDMGFAHGWIQAEVPESRTGKKVAVVGSGPAGLAAAQQLNRAGHLVTIFEKADRPGGLLMYGIPDFKLEKDKVERRIELLKEEGVIFKCGINVGIDVSMSALRKDFDAVLLASGAGKKRDLEIQGRIGRGVHFAEEFLSQSTRRVLGDSLALESETIATHKDVIVIGGGDTGSDCIGTANRQGAKSVTQFEIMNQPPRLPKHPRQNQRPSETPWPHWPSMLRTTSSHEEGCAREWSLQSVRFERNTQGQLESLITQEVEWFTQPSGRKDFRVIENSEKRWPCQLVLIAIGFSGADATETLADAGVAINAQGCIATHGDTFQTNVAGVFSAGDVRRGQSLVVWAIAEGRKAAESIHRFLS